MNGSRSNIPGTGDRLSLDALSRTIEGLEARIEGLMGSTAARDFRQASPGRDFAQDRMPRPERELRPRPLPERPVRPETTMPSDPLAEIRQRQRALEASRERGYARMEEPQAADRQPPAARAASMAPRETPRQQSAYRAAPDVMTEIAQALVGLRQDLKQDISEGVAREMDALRAEFRSIRTSARDQDLAREVRHDLGRLAESIEGLAGHPSQSEAAELKAEFDELRSLLDGLAREDSLRSMEQRWDGFEDRLQGMETGGVQEELVALAYRLDDIKRQLGGMSESPAVRVLEDKLISIASAMEQFGNLMQPHGRAMSEQFSAIDMRLDEISRAIAAAGRSAASGDTSLHGRLERRLDALAGQIEMIGQESRGRGDPAQVLGARIEALTLRIEELANAEAATRLDQRIDELAHMMQRSQKAAHQPELTSTLADISRKIDALENGSVNDVLAERLDYLARRIDEMELSPPAAAPAIDEGVFRRLESRLGDVASLLEESIAAPASDTGALRNLEAQIANLSALMMEPRDEGVPADIDRRVNALEDYMATNDEYIIEAARQAAEAVVQAYARGGTPSAGYSADIPALAALAEDLRHLEDLSRSTEERTHNTFQALHETLVHIADRLDTMESGAGRAAVHPTAKADFNEASLEYADLAMGDTAFGQREPARATPVIRTSAPVEEQPDVQAVVDAPPPASKKAKSSLIAGLGRRFRPGRKHQAAPTDRPVIDPAPSIDPVDVVPPEAANEPLEPGSGAPDVKKILERVRASQNAARSGAARPALDSDRADYIAAARRAAQAAALEVDQSDKATPARQDKTKPTGSAFARHRRPILLAVGAVLLAIMSFPLINTLTHGQKAPAPAQIATLTSAVELPPLGGDNGLPPVAKKNVSTAVASMAAPIDVSELTPPPAPDIGRASPPERLTEAQPIGDGAPAVLAPSAPSVAQNPSTFVAKNAPAQTAPAIVVPAAIEPTTLADAARGGDPVAFFEIATRFSEGRGVAADAKQAASWYQLAADKGFAPAQYRMGSIYEKGNGAERDTAKAKHYYELAANQGNASAMHNLAVLYASGTGGAADFATAANWFTKAANLGVVDSQFNLAILYARGNGVTSDLGESYKWFAVAARGGDQDAAQKRDEVAKAMKPQQLDEARSKADLWKPQPLDSRANSVDIPDDWSGKGPKTATIDMKKAIRNIQAILNNNGFDAGTPDGEMGEKTVTAIKNFQKSIGQEPTGKVSDALVKELLARNK
ncbi:peptidoglycan-binding protein [Rhizobium sp. BK251]|uniref:peptidoglycan-binding protein n=1 Tax=Rhizobium sp. BK251 TaxID=2512125 RepID=UPI0010526F73|nr:peptidoglycan-binding protein [Rhizobium sp. BK251]TCL75545.1 localization factor PodJL [Rhizobium sp. BK251]